MEKTYIVNGMSCIICKAAVEKAISKTKGVVSCAVNLMDNEAMINFDENIVKIEDIARNVKDAGYELVINESKNNDSQLTKLIVSIILLVILMVNSMIFKQYRYSQLIIALIIYILNFHYFKSGIRAFLNKEPNMDSLVSISSGVSFLYSIYVLISNNGFLFFESGSMILVVVSIGKKIEGINKKKTTKVIRGLSTLIPMQANKIIDGKEVITPIEEIRKNDILIIKPGESVPSDGVVIEGVSSLDESLITGESLAQIKTINSEVIAGTVNIEGTLKIRVTKNNNQSLLSSIVSLTKQASFSKTKIQRFADKISKYFVWTILLISLVVFVIWFYFSKDFELSLSFSLCVLVISCPCALGLAAPCAIVVASGQSAKNGILIKNPEVLEIAGKIKNIVLDKTGTLTENKLVVKDERIYDEDFIKILTSLESKSNHPIAKSIIEKYGEGELDLNITFIPSEGIEAGDMYAGNNSLLKRHNIFISQEDLEYAIKNNYSYIGVGKNEKLLGIVYLEDKIKESSKEAIDGFKKRNIKPFMATGDNEIAAKKSANKLKIDDYIFEAKPNRKQELINELKKEGLCAMVGDGINDTISLSSADVSFTLNSGCDIAHASSDIILMHDDLNAINYFVDLSKKTMRIIKQNMFWALFYNALFIPLSAGVLYPVYGIKLSPMIGAITMSISSIIVLTNALRIKK